MKGITFCLVGDNKALQYAGKFLTAQGVNIAPSPTLEVTHLLLPVPSLSEEALIKGGIPLDSVLPKLGANVTIMGGNLNHAAFHGYTCIDFLKDPLYLAKNAEITADCTLASLSHKLPVTLSDCRILLIGWGRIGKCLADKLRALRANITVLARKETDRATLKSLGFSTIAATELPSALPDFRAVINTAPTPVLTETEAQLCNRECVLLDLASKPGILSDNVYWERGLPNRDAPETSGKLIAETALRFLSERS